MKRLLSTLALAAGALFATSPASADIVVSFVPTATHIAVGESVSVQMNISGLDAEILSAFDVNMLFNNAIVANNSVTHSVASQWSGASVFGPSVFGPGDTDVVDYTFDDDATLAANQANAFTVLTFGFTGLADGTTFLNLGADPDFQRNFVGLNFASLAVDVQGVCISVGLASCETTAVPEPATYSLAALGLLAAGMASRRRRARIEP